MKLHADHATAASVQAYGEGWIQVLNQRHEGSLLLSYSGAVVPWTCQRFEDLVAADFEQLLSHEPELVVFGSGTRLRFPHPSLHASLVQAGVGLETMGTGAACRTYNILVQEGRRVVAVLLPETA
jgi:uncharacterized protein